MFPLPSAVQRHVPSSPSLALQRHVPSSQCSSETCSLFPVQFRDMFPLPSAVRRHVPSSQSSSETCSLFPFCRHGGSSAVQRHVPCYLSLTLQLFVGCLTSQQQASVSQGRICSDNFTCCHTEIEAADQTFHLTQSQYTDTGPTSPSADPITPGAWQGSHWSANLKSLV